jgi:hypothetical protein
MNQAEMDRLALAVHALRPEWRADSLRTWITHNLAGRAVLDASLALVWVALDQESRTPERVLSNGPWWAAGNPRPAGSSAPQPPHITSADTCRVCRKTRTGHDHLAELTEDQHPFTASAQADKPSPEQIHNHVAAVKAALHQGDPNHD